MQRIRQVVQGRKEVYLLRPEMTLQEAAQYLAAHNIGGAPVESGGKLVGFCSERDLVYKAVATGQDPQSVRVAELMTKDVVTGTLDDTLQEAERRMQSAHCRHLPILDGDQIVACLSTRDLLRSELKECEMTVEHLENYIQGAGGPGGQDPS